jgi:ElaB/YqjD/DUF883 family membrane-anchored ribosome-binding protein
MGVLKQWLAKIEKRKMQGMLDIVPVWYNTCLRVSEICGDALHDEALIRADIGTVLDKADRMLFQFRNDASDVRKQVQRYDESLAKKVERMTQQVYELRNATAKFLIRAQGPSPFAKSELEGESGSLYYHRALQETGFKARQMKTELDQDLKALWNELEKLMRIAELSAKA